MNSVLQMFDSYRTALAPAAAVFGIALASCSSSENPCGFQTTSPACGVVREDLQAAALSLGVSNNSGFAPNSAAAIKLDFNELAPGSVPQATVLSVAVPDGSVVADGLESAGEWEGVPSTSLSLSLPSDILSPDRNPNNLVAADHGINEAEVWSAYDSAFIYVRVRWSDATKNDVAGQWTFVGGQWEQNQGAPMEQVDPSVVAPRLVGRTMDRDQDRLFLSFNLNQDPETYLANNGCAGMCHLETTRALSDAQDIGGTLYYFGGGYMSMTNPGERADLWAWRATDSAGAPVANDRYFRCGRDEACSGTWGLSHDDGESWSFSISDSTGNCNRVDADPSRQGGATTDVEMYFVNEWFVDNGTDCVSQGPSKKPIGSPPLLASEGVLFAADADNIVGTELWSEGDVLPGAVHRNIAPNLDNTSACEACTVEARGTWESGFWTVEFRRRLEAPNAEWDANFLAP